MKHFFFTLLIFGLSLQTVSAQSIFDRYENSSEVSYMSISPIMFKMLGQMSVSTDDPEAKEFLNLVNSIKKFKVLTCESETITAEMAAWVNDEVKKKKLDVLMTIKEGGTDINFYVKEGASEDRVAQLLMFVNERTSEGHQKNMPLDIESVLLMMEGDIDLNQISKLTSKMDLPWRRTVEKSTKKQIALKVSYHTLNSFMMKNINLFAFSLTTVFIFSCTHQPSLERYFVEKMEDSSFLFVNVPIDFKTFFSEEELTNEEADALANVHKNEHFNF